MWKMETQKCATAQCNTDTIGNSVTVDNLSLMVATATTPTSVGDEDVMSCYKMFGDIHGFYESQHLLGDITEV